MKTLIISLLTLAVGLLAGIAFMQYKASPRSAPVVSASAVSHAAQPPGNLPDINQWDPFTEMRRMQQEMDRAFNDSIAQLHQQPPFNAFPDAPGYSLSLDVREFKDRFEVHAALPDAKASDVNVKLDNDRTLTVEVSHQANAAANSASSQGPNSAMSEEWGQYSQTVRLPSPVQVNKMRTVHKGHELVIILPKA